MNGLILFIPHNYNRQLFIIACFADEAFEARVETAQLEGGGSFYLAVFSGFELSYLMSGSSPKNDCYGRVEQKCELSSKICVGVDSASPDKGE